MSRSLFPISYAPRSMDDDDYARWHGLPVKEYTGTVRKIANLLPTFEVRPLRLTDKSASSVNPRFPTSGPTLVPGDQRWQAPLPDEFSPLPAKLKGELMYYNITLSTFIQIPCSGTLVPGGRDFCFSR